jgi:hypothetical protein
MTIGLRCLQNCNAPPGYLGEAKSLLTNIRNYLQTLTQSFNGFSQVYRVGSLDPSWPNPNALAIELKYFTNPMVTPFTPDDSDATDFRFIIAKGDPQYTDLDPITVAIGFKNGKYLCFALKPGNSGQTMELISCQSQPECNTTPDCRVKFIDQCQVSCNLYPFVYLFRPYSVLDGAGTFPPGLEDYYTARVTGGTEGTPQGLGPGKGPARNKADYDLHSWLLRSFSLLSFSTDDC